MRGCGRKTNEFFTCDSLLIPVTMNYSIVCGRIYAYHRGRSAAFRYRVYWSPLRLGVNASIDSPYVSGLSLTHGFVGQRKHVWTFAGARMKQLNIIVITSTIIPGPVPVLILQSTGVIKFPLMLVTVTYVTQVFILLMMISTRSS